MRRFVKESKKKAFTLVELLVVIAILAILAGVSVVGYLGFTEKANKSVDEQICTQYNTLLKAQSALDQDISLAEFVQLLEENGINANQFDTHSKSYKFAYYPEPVNGDNQVVLLDKDSGTIAYPENKNLETDKLWCAIDDKGKMQKNIINYTLFKSHSYSDMTNTNIIDKSKTYNLDLNNHSFTVSSAPDFQINVENGVVINKVSSDKVKVDTTSAKSIDPSSALTVKNTTEFGEQVKKKIDTNTTGKVKVSGKNFFTSDKDVVNAEFPSPTTADAQSEKTVIIENCVFDNYSLAFNQPDVNLIVRNCEFYNTKGNIFNVTLSKSFEFTGNKVYDSNRCLNINLAQTNTIIENNTFNLEHTLTNNKNERKDNVLQFAFGNKHLENLLNGVSKGQKISDISLKNSGIKVSVKNNVVEKANSLISLHASAVHMKSTDVSNAIKNLLITSDIFTIENNTLKQSSTVKFFEDPGVADDINNNDQSLDGYNSCKLDVFNNANAKDYPSKVNYSNTESAKTSKVALYKEIANKLSSLIK